MQIFKIPYPPKKTEWTKRYSLNKYYSGVHWTTRQNDANFWHTITRAYSHGLHAEAEPVIISFYFNDGLDISNHAAIAKMIEDGLKGKVIADDSRKYVIGHEYYFHDEDNITIKITAVTEKFSENKEKTENFKNLKNIEKST